MTADQKKKHIENWKKCKQDDPERLQNDSRWPFNPAETGQGPELEFTRESAVPFNANQSTQRE
jgi:hypothetical protein